MDKPDKCKDCEDYNLAWILPKHIEKMTVLQKEDKSLEGELVIMLLKMLDRAMSQYVEKRMAAKRG